jgi:hypothetical protein
MNRASPHLRHLAKLLIVHETRENKSGASGPAAFHVSEKLRPHLVALMGSGAFRALLARALALTTVEIPRLHAVSVQADGTLNGVEELQLDAGEFLEVRIVLLARTLGLLATFIGDGLTLRLVRELWPKVPLDGLDLGEGKEKTKKGKPI